MLGILKDIRTPEILTLMLVVGIYSQNVFYREFVLFCNKALAISVNALFFCSVEIIPLLVTFLAFLSISKVVIILPFQEILCRYPYSR